MAPCYARISDARTGERLPTFSVQLDPPPEGDRVLAAVLARLSAERYGRHAVDVELDLQSALARIGRPRQGMQSDEADGSAEPPTATPNEGTPVPQGVVAGGEVPEP